MHGHDPLVTWVFAGLLAAMIGSLALEELIHAKKSMITGFYAVLALFLGAVFGILPFGQITLPDGHHVEMPVFVPAVDWGVITIILGASLFVDVVSRSGIFTWLAIKLTRASAGDPFRLLVAYAVLTVGFSAVLNNVTAMIIVGSLTAVSLERLGKRDLMLGFLLAEGLLTNIGGLLTLISSVPNIILGNMAGIPFLTFTWVAAPYVVVATAATVGLAAWWFGIRRLTGDAERQRAAALVAGFDENDGVPSPVMFWYSWALLIAFCAVIAAASALPWVSELGLGFVAMAFAIVALLRYRNEIDKAWAAFDWDLLFFFVFLFVVINAAEHAGVLGAIGEGLGALIGLGDQVGTVSLLWASAIASSVTDNVPLAAVLGKILAARPGITAESPLWWSCIFGANLGGNFTPIGSASTVVAVAVLHKNGIKLSFVGFVKAAAPFALLQLVLATLQVLWLLR